ncbi:MAG TPA: hypothetical protein VFN97_18725 [Actinospica sp.]|nr:hypothetical protein [Actinospica sp.]
MSLPPYDQSIRELERQYQVVLPDSVGQPALGFREGVWFRVSGGSPRPVQIRSAIILCPHAAGSIVQIACWWMRENAHTSRALDLATELALCVGELARKAIADDPLGMSLDDSLSSSQQNAVAGYAAGLAQSAAGVGLGATGGYDSPGYQSGGYQTSNDPYGSPYGAPAAGATTVLPQIPADGYGMPPAQRGPAIPPRGQGMPGGGPGGSGGYPQQRPAQPMRPQPRQQGGYPPQQGQPGRPPQRPAPRPEYEDDPYGRPQGRPQARPDQSW